MKKLLNRVWMEDEGFLSFEWVLLVTLLTFGIITGIAGARDAITDEFGDVAQAMLALDQSYTIDFPLEVIVHTDTASGMSDSEFIDSADYTDCARNTAPLGQPAEDDLDS